MKICHISSRNFVLTNTDRDKHVINLASDRRFGLTDIGDRKHREIYRMVHEKPARRLVDQRGCKFRTLYRKLNRCKCKVLTG